MSNLEISEDDRIRIIAINRPERRNAVDLETARELFEAFSAFDKDDAFDVAILTGKSGAFCAGADLKALGGEDFSARVPDGGRTRSHPWRISYAAFQTRYRCH